MPYAIAVNSPWYLEQNPDVEEAIGKKLFPSAQAHFDSVGFIEGRLPFPGFTLLTVAETEDLLSDSGVAEQTPEIQAFQAQPRLVPLRK